MRLITKEDRKTARAAWIQNRETEVYKDIEILKYTNTAGNIHTLVIWQGSAGNPSVNYCFRNPEGMERHILNAKASADRREKYKKENADNRGKVVTEAAKTSQLIKSILKKEYPKIKFSVTSENFAGGNSVNVSWEDGIPSKDLDGFLNQFQCGHFDGMQDLYEYDNKKNMPQVKYIIGRREVSKEKMSIIKADLARLMGIENNDTSKVPELYMVNVSGFYYGADLNALSYQISVNYDFTKGFHGVRNKVCEGGGISSNMFELY